MKISLVIMATRLGSRFGQGIKQLEPVGLSNEIIMDYSIHDAIKAGFKLISKKSPTSIGGAMNCLFFW